MENMVNLTLKPDLEVSWEVDLAINPYTIKEWTENIRDTA